MKTEIKLSTMTETELEKLAHRIGFLEGRKFQGAAELRDEMINTLGDLTEAETLLIVR